MSRAFIVLPVLALLACQSGAAVGDLCTRNADCPGALQCSRGRCRAACATSSDCPPLARCLLDPSSHALSCSLDVDSCATHACPLGFVCQDDQCLNACDTLVRCPDGVCAGGACIPQRVDAGAPVPDAGTSAPHITHLAAGATHFCAIGTNQTITDGVWCWGEATSFELGDGLVGHPGCVGCALAPQPAADASGPMHGVGSIAAGPGFTCAARGGTVDCWGAYPLAGGASSTPRRIDAFVSAISPLDDVRDMVAGVEHVCVRRGDALQAWCFGLNPDGRLGDGTRTDRAQAVQATEISLSYSLRATWYHTLGLGGGGDIIGVGNNDGFALGVTNPTPVTMRATAAEPPAREFATSAHTTCEVRAADGRIACWGAIGALVRSGASDMACISTCTLDPTLYATPPDETVAGLAIVQSAAPDTICLWTMSGHAYCLGHADLALDSATFTAVPGLTQVEEIVAGTSSMCARTTPGEVWCWGANDLGQLGSGVLGSTAGDPHPVRVAW